MARHQVSGGPLRRLVRLMPLTYHSPSSEEKEEGWGLAGGGFQSTCFPLQWSCMTNAWIIASVSPTQSTTLWVGFEVPTANSKLKTPPIQRQDQSKDLKA